MSFEERLEKVMHLSQSLWRRREQIISRAMYDLKFSQKDSS
jgi:hypothetical protein